jgi:outer membrane protein, heavy metal efflux system
MRTTTIPGLWVVAVAVLLFELGWVEIAPAQTVLEIDLTLQRAYELLPTQNRVVRTARRALEIATAEVSRVNVRPNPTVSAQISNTNANRYPYGESDRIFRVEQLFERGNKRELRTAGAEAAERAARLDLADALRQQRAALASSYYDLAASQQLVQFARENAGGYQKLIAAAERRVNAGDLAPVDASRLRIEANRAANDLRGAEAALEQAQIALAAVLGDEAAASKLRAADPLYSREEIEQSALKISEGLAPASALAIDRRADVLAAGARTDSAEQGTRLAESLRTRDWTLGLQTERAPAFGGTVVGISASIPVFINNDFSGDIARARADLSAAREEVERTRALVRGDIDRALAQLLAARDRASRLLSSAVPDASKVAQAVEFAFNKGAMSLTDLFDARRQLVAVRADAVSAQADFGKAIAAYRAAVSLEEIQ